MTLRPYPILTLFTLAALALLLWLGSWQLDRRAWKADMLEAWAETAEAAPLDPVQALCAGEAAIGRAADPDGLTLAGEARLKLYGRDEDGAPGWRLLSAARLPECAGGAAILIETGFVPLRQSASGPDPVERPVTALRYEPPSRSGAFTPQPSGLEFYAVDADAMATALGLAPGGLRVDWMLARDTGEAPAHLTQTPPERHAAYALTWFLMALALVGVWIAFHVRAGRIRLT